MQDEAVTPVVGTVMILGITVLGIGAIMFWGAPTLQAIQDQNSVVAMQGELIEVRTGTLDLMIDKSSRVPQVLLESGSLEIEQGTRFLITSDAFNDLHGADAYTDCHLIIAGWEDGGDFTIAQSCSALGNTLEVNCDNAAANAVCIEVVSVSGSNEAAANLDAPTDGGTTWGLSFTDGSDLAAGTWALRAYDGSGNLVAQSWLLETDRIRWYLSTISGQYGVSLEGGAVFETDGIRSFLVKAPALQEDASGEDDVFLRMPSYLSGERSGVTGPATIGVFIGQVGNNHVRIQSDATDQISYQFDGELAESWCRSLLARNNLFASDRYAEPTTDSCNDDPAVLTYDLGGTSFPFELSHARITTRLQL